MAARIGGRAEHLLGQLGRVLEVFELLEQGHRPQLARAPDPRRAARNRTSSRSLKVLVKLTM